MSNQEKKLPEKTVRAGYKIGFIVQLIMTFITTIFIIVAFFQRDFFTFLEFLLGLDMFVLAFNNFKYYKRDWFTFVYIAAGAAMILVSILKWCDIL